MKTTLFVKKNANICRYFFGMADMPDFFFFVADIPYIFGGKR